MPYILVNFSDLCCFDFKKYNFAETISGHTAGQFSGGSGDLACDLVS